ncbi:hypothetical protein HYV69_03905 [Candidatus Uhrbacteria bacterium]|nr:hypothetical protein [Candidatus Uhrbacteria bacterium]
MPKNQIKTLLLFAIIISASWVLPAQAADWIAQTSGTTVSLNSIDMYNVITGLAVGDSGVILKTTNGGQLWLSKGSVVNNWQDVDFVSSNIAWVVGDGGKIMKSENGGDTWTSVTSGVTTTLRSIQFLSSETGFIVGSSGTILYTFDSGATWTQQAPLTTQTLFGVSGGSYSFGLKRAWAVGSGGVILKFDTMGGWTTQNSGTTNTLQDVYVKPGTDSAEVWVAANGVSSNGGPGFLKTINSGLNWSVVSQSVSTTGGITSVKMSSSGIGLATLTTGKLLKSTDGGSNWILNKDVGGYLTDTVSIDDYAWAVGWTGKIWLYDSALPSGVSIMQTTSNNDNTPTFSWSSATDDVQGTYGTGISHYEYSLDGAAYVNIGSGLTLTLSQAITDGNHTFAVRAVDNAGNIGSATTKNFSIDTTAPSIGIATGSATATVGVSQNFSASYSDNFGLNICYLIVNNTPQGSVNIPGTATGTAQINYVFPSAGNYSVYFACHDTADNVGYGAPISVVVSAAVNDTSAPTGTIKLNNDSAATNSTAVTLATTCTDNVGCAYMQVSVDGTLDTEQFESYSTSKTIYLPSGDGNKTVKVKFKDSAGNLGMQYTSSIILDTTAQETSIIQEPSSSTSDTTATFTFGYGGTSITSVAFECRMDTSIFSACTSPKSYSGLSSGSHTFYVRAVDAALNYDATPASYSWTITGTSADTSSPSTPPNLQKISSTGDTTPTFTWNASTDNAGVTSYLVQVDDGSLIDIGGNLTYTTSSLANGSHTIKILAKDAAGNTSPTASFSFTVDSSQSSTVECSLTIGSAYKLSTSPAVYYITEDCTKRAFTNPNIFFSYFDSWSDVKTISKSSLDAVWNDPLGFMPWGPKYDPKYGALVKIVADPKVYLLLGTERYWITSETVFLGLNYSWSWIEDVDKALLYKYTIGSEINYTDHHPNYTIVKYATSPKVYRLEPDPSNSSKQVKKHILNETVFNSLNFRWDRIVTIPASEVYIDGTVIL